MKITYQIALASLYMGVMYFTTLSGSAQNLVTNGDFEIYTTLPSNFSEIRYCKGWNNAGGNATPDYYHLQGMGDAQLPNTGLGTVHPYSGSGVAGFYTYISNQVWHEYISCSLAKPMVKGDCYVVSFWLVNGSGNPSNGASSNHIGLRFSEKPLQQTSCDPVPVIPQIDILENIWTTTWQPFSFFFVADSAYQYLTIGNFYTDAQTNVVLHPTIIPFYGAYYYIDNVEVSSIGPVVITLELPNLITPNQDESNDLLTPIKSLGITSMHTQIYNRWGSKVYDTNKLTIDWDGENNSDGVYYWNVQYIDFYGNEGSQQGIVQLMR